MLKIIAPIAALLFSVALLQAGNGLQGTLLPVRAAIEHFSTFSIGLLGSTYFVGFIAGCVFGARLIRRVGHIRVFTAMAAIASVTPLIHGLVLSPISWWVLRVITGFCFAVLYIVIESWLNERATRETRGSIFAIYLIINLTVMTLGQMTLTLFDVDGLVLFAIAAILVSVAAVPIALSPSPGPEPISRARLNIIKVFRISPVGFVGCFAVGAANGAFWALGPGFASAGGLPVAGIALFMSATVIGGAIGQWPIGKISDRYDRRKVMAIVCGLSALLGIALWWLGDASGNWLYLLTAAWGFMAFPLYGLAAAHANDFAEPDQFVEVSGALLLIYAAGAIIGPMVAAVLMSSLHASWLFAYTALVHVGLMVYIAWRAKCRRSAPSESRVRFIDALEAVQSVSPAMDTAMQEEMIEEDRLESARQRAGSEP